ncbi:MAG: HAD-IIB family hydrolase [Sphingomonadaceae bacterium]|nr:HAD-IIB family hydrolase [Sphingomonadaceae bacterium]
MKRLIAFDLDGTLAESKQAIDAEMGALLAGLSRWIVVAVISGGDWPQFQQQLIGNLPKGIDLSRWFLLPTSGTKLYRHEGGDWRQVYAQSFTDDERTRILRALDTAVVAAGLSEDRIWGDRIEDRGSQITFSGLGQHAPLEAKQLWDPDFIKRKRLQAALAPLLPRFAVRVGGSTSIDITREGVDKAFGMSQLADVAGIPTKDMIFLGDAIYPGGNDDAVRAAGIDSIAVRDVHETKRVAEGITLCLAGMRE